MWADIAAGRLCKLIDKSPPPWICSVFIHSFCGGSNLCWATVVCQALDQALKAEISHAGFLSSSSSDSVRKPNVLLHRVMIHAKPEEGKGSMGAQRRDLSHPSDRVECFTLHRKQTLLAVSSVTTWAQACAIWCLDCYSSLALSIPIMPPSTRPSH